MLSSTSWASLFAANRAGRAVLPWDQGLNLPPPLAQALLPSFQRFQVGERGGGAHLLAAAAAAGCSPDHLAALRLFVAEEQEHARLLARIVELLGGRPLERHWTERAFVWLRRLAGLHTELLVLLTAEIIGYCFYRAVFQSTNDQLLRAILGQMLEDEERHLAFHRDTLGQQLGAVCGPTMVFLRLAWRSFFACVCGVVIWDHRAALRALGLAPNEFWLACSVLRYQADAMLWAPRAPAGNLPSLVD